MLNASSLCREHAVLYVGFRTSQDKGTQASASQDILTLMKEWRIEASESDQGSEDARLEGETPTDDHQQAVTGATIS